MSGSPKYTNAALAAAREREIEERRRERKRQRARAEREARAQRIAQRRTALLARVDQLADQLRAIGTAAADTGLGGRCDTLIAEIATAGTRVRAAADESALRAADAEVTSVDAHLQRLGVDVSDVLAQRHRAAAVDTIRAALAGEPDRHELDPAAARQVDELLAQAVAAVADEDQHAAVYRELSRAADAHLSAARARRLELREMRDRAAVAVDTIADLLAETAAAEAGVDGVPDARKAMDELVAAAAAGDVPTARRLTDVVRAATATLNETFEQWLVEQDRTAIIIEAMRAALPAAGLSVVDGTFETDGSGGRFVARDATRRTVEIAVVHTEYGSRIVYHADGRDFTVEHTADGDVARCDLTEELLAKFHGELARHDIETGELYWPGKPQSRPDQRTHKALPVSRPRSAGTP